MKYILIILCLVFFIACDDDDSTGVSEETESQVSQNTTMIDMIKNDIASLFDMVETLQNDIDVLNNEENMAEEESPENQNCCEDLQNQLNNIETDITDLQMQIDNFIISSSLNVNVVDSNDNILGPIIGGTLSQPRILLQLEDMEFFVEVRKIGVIGTFSSVVFANNDCTGQAYIVKDSIDDSVMPLRVASVAPLDATIDPTNETLYEADLMNDVNTTVNSSWSVSDKTCNVIGGGFTSDFYVADPVFNLSSLFTPPYSIQ